jgi:hypothetical protein
MIDAVAKTARAAWEQVAHYPVLFWGAVGLTIGWHYPHMSLAGKGVVGAWILFLQTISSASKKGVEDAKEQARNETLADVASLAPLAPDEMVARPGD